MEINKIRQERWSRRGRSKVGTRSNEKEFEGVDESKGNRDVEKDGGGWMGVAIGKPQLTFKKQCR